MATMPIAVLWAVLTPSAAASVVPQDAETPHSSAVLVLAPAIYPAGPLFEHERAVLVEALAEGARSVWPGPVVEPSAWRGFVEEGRAHPGGPVCAATARPVWLARDVWPGAWIGYPTMACRQGECVLAVQASAPLPARRPTMGIAPTPPEQLPPGGTCDSVDLPRFLVATVTAPERFESWQRAARNLRAAPFERAWGAPQRSLPLVSSWRSWPEQEVPLLSPGDLQAAMGEARSVEAILELDASGRSVRCDADVAPVCGVLASYRLTKGAGRAAIRLNKRQRHVRQTPVAALAEITSMPAWHGLLGLEFWALEADVARCARNPVPREVHVGLVTEPTGRVLEASAVSFPTSDAVERCAEDAARAWSFPCTPPDGSTEFTLSFTVEARESAL